MSSRTHFHGDLSRVSREMDRLFETVAPGVASWLRPATQSRATFPLINVWQDEQAAFIEAELPGLSLDDVDVTVTGDALSIKGVRANDASESVNVVRQERLTGAFERTVPLTPDVDLDRVEATLQNGVLRIVLPKTEAPSPRRINVRTGTESN